VVSPGWADLDRGLFSISVAAELAGGLVRAITEEQHPYLEVQDHDSVGRG